MTLLINKIGRPRSMSLELVTIIVINVLIGGFSRKDLR